MKDDFLIVHKKILPVYFEKVLETRRLLESGAERDVSAAVRRTGISRSTYYKYKDYIFGPDNGSSGRKAVLSLLLNHEIGVLSNVLNRLSVLGANVLTISQSLPVNGMASVVITLDIEQMESTVEEVLCAFADMPGVEKTSLTAVE